MEGTEHLQGQGRVTGHRGSQRDPTDGGGRPKAWSLLGCILWDGLRDTSHSRTRTFRESCRAEHLPIVSPYGICKGTLWGPVGPAAGLHPYKLCRGEGHGPGRAALQPSPIGSATGHSAPRKDNTSRHSPMGSAVGQDKLQGQQPNGPSPILCHGAETPDPSPHWVLPWGRTCCMDPSNSGLSPYTSIIGQDRLQGHQPL